jgi:hypothetical protein
MRLPTRAGDLVPAVPPENTTRCVAAAREQPGDAGMLRSDLMDPSQLADAVLNCRGEIATGADRLVADPVFRPGLVPSRRV